MLAISQKISHKRQRRRNVGFLTPSNQNEGLTRMTEFQFTSIIWLTQGKFAIVDNEDYARLSQYKWHFLCNGYGARNSQTLKRRKVMLMHREIIQTPEGMHTDHIDGNKLNNRKLNLRICRNSQNRCNMRLHIDSTSGYKGVAWHKGTNKWQARIRVNDKTLWLGLFENAADAARVYDNAALRLHGEFAKTNKMIGRL